MTPLRLLNFIMVVLLSYNTSFFLMHWSDQARLWKDELGDVQAILNILELIAVAVLFVDLVIRYDNIAPKWRIPRVALVGLCVVGFLFKLFILYLQLSYLTD